MSVDLSSFTRRYLEAALYAFEHTNKDHVWLWPDERAGVTVDDLSGWLPAMYSGGVTATVADIEREFAERPKREFKRQHELSEDEFNDPHWQTLFAIQYPEARS